ncbi:MAG: 50S ribosomal protein L13 [Candidatus Micrarchaeia archaeon]
MADETVIDGKGKILGRVASTVAKMLLNNKKVALVNAGEILISGHPESIVQKYKQRIELKDKANPEHSPYWPRRPDMLVRRIIRGMLPYKKAKGKNAYKLLRVYAGLPESLKNAKFYELNTKSANQIFEKTMSINELSEKLGYKR